MLVAGCSTGSAETGPVDVSPPELSATESQACRNLIEALPDRLGDARRREVSPPQAPAAAWGEEPIVLTCGVDEPPDFDPFAPCLQVGEVGWFVPDAIASDQSADAVMTTVGWRPGVSVVVPAALRPAGPAAIMAELGPIISAQSTLVKPCH